MNKSNPIKNIAEKIIGILSKFKKKKRNVSVNSVNGINTPSYDVPIDTIDTVESINDVKQGLENVNNYNIESSNIVDNTIKNKASLDIDTNNNIVEDEVLYQQPDIPNNINNKMLKKENKKVGLPNIKFGKAKLILNASIPVMLILFSILGLTIDNDFYNAEQTNVSNNIDGKIAQTYNPPTNGFFIYEFKNGGSVYNTQSQSMINLSTIPQMPDKFDTVNSYVRLKLNNSYISDTLRSFYKLDNTVENETEKDNLKNKIINNYGGFNPYSVTVILGPNTIGELGYNGMRIEKGIAYICSNSTTINITDNYSEILFNTEGGDEFSTGTTNKCILIKSEQGFFNVYPTNNITDMYLKDMEELQPTNEKSKFVYISYAVTSNLKRNNQIIEDRTNNNNINDINKENGNNDNEGDEINMSQDKQTSSTSINTYYEFTQSSYENMGGVMGTEAEAQLNKDIGKYMFLENTLTLISDIKPTVLMLDKAQISAMNFVKTIRDLNVLPSSSFLNVSNSNLKVTTNIGSVIPYQDKIVIKFNNELETFTINGGYTANIGEDRTTLVINMPLLIENTKIKFSVKDIFGNSLSEEITVGKKNFSINIVLTKGIAKLNWTIEDPEGTVEKFKIIKNGAITQEFGKEIKSFEITKDDVGNKYIICGYNARVGCISQSNEVKIELADVVTPKINFNVKQISFNRVKVTWSPSDLNGQKISGYEIGYSYKNPNAFCGNQNVKCKTYNEGTNSDIIEFLEYNKEYTFTISMFISGSNNIITESSKITLVPN